MTIVAPRIHSLVVPTEWNIPIVDEFGTEWATEYHWIELELRFTFRDGEVAISSVRVVEDSVTDSRWGSCETQPVFASFQLRVQREFMRLYECDPDFIAGWHRTILEEREWWI